MSTEKPTDLITGGKYSLQEYLSLGYVYLIVLGIVGDVIYYKFLKINILEYSTISDVLLAPVNTLLYDLRVLLMVLAVMVLLYRFYFRAQPANKSLSLILVFFPLLFVGLKVGAGLSMKRKMEQGTMQANQTLVLNDNSIKQVKTIGQNGGYIFYVVPGEKNITILPISGNVKEIRLTGN